MKLFKFLIIILSQFTLFSCSKQTPIQYECGNAKWITEFYDLNKKHIRDSVTYSTPSVVCGQQFQNYKIEETKNHLVPFTSYCPNGVTLYYMRYIIKTSK